MFVFYRILAPGPLDCFDAPLLGHRCFVLAWHALALVFGNRAVMTAVLFRPLLFSSGLPWATAIESSVFMWNFSRHGRAAANVKRCYLCLPLVFERMCEALPVNYFFGNVGYALCGFVSSDGSPRPTTKVMILVEAQNTRKSPTNQT